MATIEELQQELRRMREEMQAMRAQVALTPTLPARGDEPQRVLSRRNLLRAVPIAAVGAGLAAMAASPAAAGTGDPLVLGQDNDAGVDVLTTLESPLQVNAPLTIATAVVTGSNEAFNTNPAMTINATSVGFHPEPQNALVVGSQGGVAITVTADDGTAFMATQPVLGTGLNVATQGGTSVVATTATGQAITATTTDAAATQDAVTITYAGTSRALYAESTAATNINGTITGVNDGAGIGVWGEHRDATRAGIGVVGVGDVLGRGGQFAGGAANLRLVPGAAATHPSTGRAGDLYVDHSARLWFCQKASVGATPAAWKQLA